MSEAKKYWCCLECGCTDVQVPVWTHANTGKVVGLCLGGRLWCPQCEETTGDGEFGLCYMKSITLQPLHRRRVMVIEDLIGDGDTFEHGVRQLFADYIRRGGSYPGALPLPAPDELTPVWFTDDDPIERAYRSMPK